MYNIELYHLVFKTAVKKHLLNTKNYVCYDNFFYTCVYLNNKMHFSASFISLIVADVCYEFFLLAIFSTQGSTKEIVLEFLNQVSIKTK